MNYQPVHILGGQSAISEHPKTIFITVLGSCVSACIYDAESGIGGMNHFILPNGGHQDRTERQQRYGDVAMRSLVDAVRGRRSNRRPLRAKLYGGRTRCPNGEDAGALNAAFARDFLQAEGIDITDESLGDDLARWVTFHPASGRVWLKVTEDVGLHLPATKMVSRRLR
ncbi:chemotaxis protein CheD [Rhizobium sp. XQZ8]|uniref:chemotaxis protein CheD n=1 Tax=Rhizobium populisoli TaxID=2859785 RepID=UPI001CA48314|nr:chemotaxis protein CheD [Rhizobium populisoli]MBW6421383.1 chemotaxis protein CheD [Rhizobium populisoli]